MSHIHAHYDRNFENSDYEWKETEPHSWNTKHIKITANTFNFVYKYKYRYES